MQVEMAPMQTGSGLLLRFARQWVAGEDVSAAILRAKERNTLGIKALINFLGEHLTEHRAIENTVAEYFRLLDLMDRMKTNGCVSIKPSQIGIRLGGGYWRKQASRILERSARSNRFLWIDMENTLDTQETLDGYRELKQSYSALGLCVQAYLKRTLGDVEKMTGIDPVLRLVKGAYNEPANLAYKERPAVSKNFSDVMKRMIESQMHFAVATHDETLVGEAISLNHDAKLPVEYQFLLGVRNDLKSQVLHLGYPVVEYIPYGTEWLAYSYRRIREKRSNFILLFRSFLAGG